MGKVKNLEILNDETHSLFKILREKKTRRECNGLLKTLKNGFFEEEEN